MKPDFSEFSYGYAVTEELVSSLKAIIVGAPEFPSLYEEGKKGGYDLKLPLSGTPVFLQFKLSDYMQMRSAREFKKGILPIPYYRMHLRPLRHSQQHKLLLSLEQSGEKVFYVAPEFHLPSELNGHYLAKSVLDNSAAFSPVEIGPLPTDESHYIAFEKGAKFAYRCSSDPKKTPKASLRDRMSSISNGEAHHRSLGEDGLRQLSEKLIQAWSRSDIVESLEDAETKGVIDTPQVYVATEERLISHRRIRQIAAERPAAEALGYISRTLFDAEVAILPAAPASKSGSAS